MYVDSDVYVHVPEVHVTRRGFTGCFAGAWSVSLTMYGTPAEPSVRALQHSLVLTWLTSVKPKPFLGSVAALELHANTFLGSRGPTR